MDIMTFPHHNNCARCGDMSHGYLVNLVMNLNAEATA